MLTTNLYLVGVQLEPPEDLRNIGQEVYYEHNVKWIISRTKIAGIKFL